MEPNRPNNIQDLFSRGATPPAPQQQHTSYQGAHAQDAASSNTIDSLFHGLTNPNDQQQSSNQVSNFGSGNSEPSTPSMPMIDEPLTSSAVSSVSATTASERQNALLSLLGQPSSNANANARSASYSGPQQVPTPPGSSQRSGASPNHNEAQGKILLEQLMSGNAPRSNYSDTSSLRGTAPSPPYGQSQHEEEYRVGGSPYSTLSHNQRLESPPRPQAGPVPAQQLPAQQSQPQPSVQPHQSPSPSRKSMFEYVSPFDALSTPAGSTAGSGIVKKKPVPGSSPQVSQAAAQPVAIPLSQSSSSSTARDSSTSVPQSSNVSVSSAAEDSGWSAISAPDLKRQSVDNLLENLTRGHPPLFPSISQPPAQLPPPQNILPQSQHISQPPPAYEPYGIMGGNEYSQGHPESIQARGGPPTAPLPTKPIARVPSPVRASPPKALPVQQPQNQAGRAPQNFEQQRTPGRRDKEVSPGPRGFRGKGPVGKFGNNNGGSGSKASPSPPSQTIVFDVLQPLDEVQAPRDFVKSTAIALVRQDSVFLPGTTIGATHWVAYAMTRGRVRVISRSSGDRTLLQLPTVFSSSSSVTDMAVYGNRLAGVTSDGGFVVWELPELITDDVPGQLMLCVPPPLDGDVLHSVKWHPNEPDTLAVASDSKIFLIDLANTHALRGQPVPQSELHHIGEQFNMTSPIVAFDFDVMHYALATISEDSVFTLWNIHDKLPYTTQKIRGDDVPSSLTFVDGGVVVGRKNGTVFQLLSMAGKNVLSTIKFVSGNQEDPDMFGHVSYDPRIQTLWIANCRRESMIAFKLNVDPAASASPGEEGGRTYFEQVVEFPGPKATIHFVILTPDADPHGDEALAACVAAKVPPGELALVAFSVHSSGVDQLLIRKEWFDQAMVTTHAKFPTQSLPQPQLPVQPSYIEPKARAFPSQGTPAAGPALGLPSQPLQPQGSAVIPPARLRTPPSEDVEADLSIQGDGRGPEGHKQKSGKGKNVNWQREDKGKANNNNNGSSDSGVISDSALGQALSKEIRKTEENLHTRIGRLIGKEMDKQHQRLEEARAHEQAEDFARQEKILKLISTELTRNTTRVVEMAVKSEVQNSVLPSLENITKTEVKSALNEQIGRGMTNFIGESLPVEIEKLLLRPDISGHFAHLLSTNLTPLLERQIKESVNKTFLPVYTQQSSSFHQEVLRELRSEMLNLKSQLTSWQTEAFRGQEASIRELEHTVRSLSDQVKYLSMNASGSSLHHLQSSQQAQNSPGPSIAHAQVPLNQPPLRQQNLPPGPPPQGNYGPHGGFPPPGQAQAVMHPTWYPTSIAAPQASHPATLPQPPAQQAPPQERTPPIKPEQWDELYLGVLHTQDASKLRDLLNRTNPDVIMPLNGPALVSQAVILTLVHRLSSVVGDTPPNDEAFKTSLWWLQRAVALLRPEDKLITDFIPRVVPNVQHSLNTTKQRLTILPGGPATLETARTLSDIQETLRRKVMPV
ncbi:hypothetical protein HGRIS_013487 [Hohenbuehelia grisea]|uniref:Uncharacterized protein n=1 Tax=Hohenbuehelia grisea TaxID=104357 RepID=A0ABR3IVL4_9AGAR